MKQIRGRMVAVTVVACFVLNTGLPLLSQTAATGSPSADQIVAQLIRNNQSRATRLHHYEGCRQYQLDYAGFPANKTAEMVVDMQYTAPADKQFRVVREEGARLLLNKVLKELLVTEKESMEAQHRSATALTPENYQFRLAGTDTFNGRPQYVLEVTPRVRTKFLYEGRVWIDAADYAVTRISAEPAKNPSIWISHTEIEHEYTKIGEFWLPARNVSITKVRLGGTATLNIRYLNYVLGDQKAAPAADVCSNLPHEVRVSEKQ
jgi:hypothetical protein